MKQKKPKPTLVLLLACCLSGIQAQEALLTTGGNASGSGGSSAWSAGQVAYKMTRESAGSIAQGMQQPYEITIISEIDEIRSPDLLISVYPNPFEDMLILTIENSQPDGYNILLTDLSGRKLKEMAVSGNMTPVDMSGLAPATYFLQVYKKHKEIKTFKIIKNE